jgi:hypothetical protein
MDFPSARAECVHEGLAPVNAEVKAKAAAIAFDGVSGDNRLDLV